MRLSYNRVKAYTVENCWSSWPCMCTKALDSFQSNIATSVERCLIEKTKEELLHHWGENKQNRFFLWKNKPCFIIIKSDQKIKSKTIGVCLPISKSCQGWAATVLRDREDRILSLSLGWGLLEFHALESSWWAMLTYLHKHKKYHTHKIRHYQSKSLGLFFFWHQTLVC